MALTKNQKITLIGCFGAAILSTVFLIAIKEYYSPDIRYEKGSFYILGNSGITFLKLKNYGHSDAENIRINIVFNKLINDFSLNDKMISLKNISGGKESQSYSGEIDRLVPSQETLLYFSTNLNSFLPNEPALISSITITYKGGLGKTGNPILAGKFLFGLIASLIVMILSIIIVLSSASKYRTLEKNYIINQLINLIKNDDTLMDKDNILKKIDEIKNRPFEE